LKEFFISSSIEMFFQQLRRKGYANKTCNQAGNASPT